jgi:coenzyme F420 hydrogenase subunit beta
MRSIKDVLAAGMCTGCGLCAFSAESMRIDEKGWTRPTQIKDDILSRGGCSGMLVDHCNSTAEYDVIWGPIKEIRTGFATEPKVRRHASSGGVITALAEFLLANNEVDGVVHVGASEKNPIRNATYVSVTPEEVRSRSGSRYAPSDPLSLVRDLLKDEKTYAFIGKPCDVAGLRRLGIAQPSIKDKFAYLISFMCAGVPSEAGTLAILKEFDVAPDQVESMRYRGDGWPGLTRVVSISQEIFSMKYNDSWGGILNRHLQSRCKVCADGTGEAADIVCADAWYETANGYPKFEEQEGRSLIIARTQIGVNLIKRVTDAKAIAVHPFDISDLDRLQPYQAARKKAAIARNAAVLVWGGRAVRYRGYKLMRAATRASIRTNLKEFAGTLRRRISNNL